MRAYRRGLRPAQDRVVPCQDASLRSSQIHCRGPAGIVACLWRYDERKPASLSQGSKRNPGSYGHSQIRRRGPGLTVKPRHSIRAE